MKRYPLLFCLLSWLLIAMIAVPSADASTRPRLRDLGIAIGIFKPGPLNAITDVAVVRVGHRTLSV